MFKPMTETEYYCATLDDISEWAENIRGEWNGDNSGKLEDRANCAEEVQDKIAELKELLEELA
jgi:hypothetical protein